MDISFVGVWDTVASVGLFPTFLPFTKSNTAIKTFRHALSLDEHRAKFKPSCYERITRGEAARGDWRVPVRRLGKAVGAGAMGKKETAKEKKESAKEKDEVAARGRSLTKKGSAIRSEEEEETVKKTLTKTTTMTTTTVTTTEEVHSQSQSSLTNPTKSASLPPAPSSSSSSPPPRPTKAPTFAAPSSTSVPASASKPRAESSSPRPDSGSGSGSRTRRLLGSLRCSARGAHDTVHGFVEPALKELGDMADRARSHSRSKSQSHGREKDNGDEKEQLSPDSERDKLEQMYLDRSRKTDVKEVWFAGVHCGESYYFHSYFSSVYAFAFRHSMDLSSFISSMTFFKSYKISAFCAFPTLDLFRASPLSTL